MAVGDLNGDGRTDVAVSRLGAMVRVFFGNGPGGFATIEDFPANQGATDIEIGDTNADGRPDLVIGSEGAHYSYLLGDGWGRFGPPLLVTNETSTPDVAVGDLDEDGRPDLALLNYAQHQVRLRFGRARTRTALTATPNPIALGGMLTLTATVTVPPPAQNAPPAGTVRFYDGNTSLGTATLGGGGVATLILPANLPWDRSYRAAYLGDGEHLGSISDLVGGTTYITAVGVPDPGVSPTGAAFALEPVRPNPVPAARGALTVRFTLPSAEPARLELFDVRGRQLAAHDVGTMGAGVHSVELVPRATLAPGIYVVRLMGNAGVRTARAVIL
jgi:hypothetical protein